MRSKSPFKQDKCTTAWAKWEEGYRKVGKDKPEVPDWKVHYAVVKTLVAGFMPAIQTISCFANLVRSVMIISIFISCRTLKSPAGKARMKLADVKFYTK